MNDRCLRIAFLCNQFFPNIGGIERHVFAMAKNMYKNGHKIFVITTNVIDGKQGLLPTIEKIENIHIFRLNRRLWKGYLKKFYCCIYILRMLKKIDPDIVHIHSYWPYYITNISLFLSKILRIPVVITPHYHPKRSVTFSLYELLLGPFILHFADCIIALTKSESLYYQNLGLKKVYVIPNGTNVPSIKNGYLIKLFKEKHGLGSQVILCVGRLEKRKGQEYLLYAISKLKKELPALQLVLVGKDSGNLHKIKSIISRLNIEDNVFLFTNLSDDDLLIAYESSYLVAIAASYEAFGITVLEAWSHEKPVIATRVGGIPSIIPPEAGILYDYGDVDSLAYSIRHLIRNKFFSEKMGKRGFELVKNYYTWDKISEDVLKVYYSLL